LTPYRGFIKHLHIVIITVGLILLLWDFSKYQ